MKLTEITTANYKEKTSKENWGFAIEPSRENTEFWINQFNIENATIHDNLTVDVEGDVDIGNFRVVKKGMGKLPIKFGKVTGSFNIRGCDLKTLYGCPYEIGTANNVGLHYYFDAAFNQFKTLDFFPKIIRGNVFMHTSGLTDMHNIHKYIKEAYYINMDVDVKNILGIFFIKNLTHIAINDHVDEIINYYLKNHDMHGCQEALIEADWAALARI